MRRAALPLLLLVCAAAARAAAPADLQHRTLRLLREIRRESLNPAKNVEPLRAKLRDLIAENAAAHDDAAAHHLAVASQALALLEIGNPLPPPEPAEAAADDSVEIAPPAAALTPAAPPAPEVLRDAVSARLPTLGGAYFDRAGSRGAAPEVPGRVDERTTVSLDRYLALPDGETRHAHLRTVTEDLLTKLSVKDEGAKRSTVLARRLHDHLSAHPKKDDFAALSLGATPDGRLHLGYLLRNGTTDDEDLGPLQDWLKEPVGVFEKGGRIARGGGGGGRGGGKGGKKGSGGKGGDGDDDDSGGGGGGGGKKGKRGGGRGKGGGGGGGGGDDDGGGGGGGGKGHGGRSGKGRAPKSSGGSSAFDGGDGGGDDAGGGSGGGGAKSGGGRRRGSGRGSGAHARAGGRMSGGKKGRTASVPLPKNSSKRKGGGDSASEDGGEPASGGHSARGKGGKGGGEGGEGGGSGGANGGGGGFGKLGLHSPFKDGGAPPAPDHRLTAGGSKPADAPAAAAQGPAAAHAPSVAIAAAADAALRAPGAAGDEELRDAVAAHSADAHVLVAASHAAGSAPRGAPAQPDGDSAPAAACAFGGMGAGILAWLIKRRLSAKSSE
jgi:hypothetical protein